MDCINLIKRLIRCAPGGVPGYTTATTVSLWESADMSAKYRDLTWRQEGIGGARAGMLAFKRHEKAADHVGLVTGEGTVIHSSSRHGRVVETALSEKEGWNLLAVHRYIGTERDRMEEEMGVQYRAEAATKDTGLNLRDAPAGKRIGVIARGETVDVLGESDGWAQVRYGEKTGYVSAAYLRRMEEENADEGRMVVIDEEGNVFVPTGGVRIEMRGKEGVD